MLKVLIMRLNFLDEVQVLCDVGADLVQCTRDFSDLSGVWFLTLFCSVEHFLLRGAFLFWGFTVILSKGDGISEHFGDWGFWVLFKLFFYIIGMLRPLYIVVLWGIFKLFAEERLLFGKSVCFSLVFIPPIFNGFKVFFTNTIYLDIFV